LSLQTLLKTLAVISFMTANVFSDAEKKKDKREKNK